MKSTDGPAKRVPVGRRVFLGVAALGALGVAFGASVQNFLGNAFGSGLGGLLPGGDRFRIYSITGTFPKIKDSDYRLRVTGLVERPKIFTLDDLKAMPSTSFVSMRAGMSIGDFSIEPFVDNLTNTHVPINYNWSIDPGTGDSRLLREYTFRPRTFGVTLTYKH